MVRGEITLESLTVITVLPPRLVLHLSILCSDVKSCLYVFFISVDIKIRCNRCSTFLFTTGISSTDVKPLLISDNCTSACRIAHGKLSLIDSN
jgi:hypothetical protein